MDLKTHIRPISYIKTNAATMLDQVNKTHAPIVITQNGEARAVLMDTESYQAMVDSLGLLKLLTQAEKDVEAGAVTTHEQLMSALHRRLAEHP